MGEAAPLPRRLDVHRVAVEGEVGRLSTISGQSLRQKRSIMQTANSSGEMQAVIDWWKPGFLFKRLFGMGGSAPSTKRSPVCRAVKLRGVVPGTISLVRILEDGRIEVEYYDGGAGAEDHFAGDVAWMCRISASDQSLLCELLEKHTAAAITDDRTLLDAFYGRFKDAWAIRHWLKEENFPFEREFDSWP